MVSVFQVLFSSKCKYVNKNYVYIAITGAVGNEKKNKIFFMSCIMSHPMCAYLHGFADKLRLQNLYENPLSNEIFECSRQSFFSRKNRLNHQDCGQIKASNMNYDL